LDYLTDAAPAPQIITKPVNVPPQGTPPASNMDNWKAAWVAAFVSTRLS
jgi:hypothetical protein